MMGLIVIIYVLIGATVVCLAMEGVHEKIEANDGKVDGAIFAFVCVTMVLVWPLVLFDRGRSA